MLRCHIAEAPSCRKSGTVRAPTRASIMKSTIRSFAVLFIAAMLAPVVSFAQSAGQKRTPPPKSAPRPAPQTRRPTPGPPARAVPRPPDARPSTRPAPRPPVRYLDGRTLTYPYYFYDFDLFYRFPYGIYPFSYYPYPPYSYPVPPTACVTAEGATEGEAAEPGALRLDIPQKEAAVYIDGYYVGAVEDFNGEAERLALRPGPHHLELRAAGFQTLTFDVNIQPGKTITYRTPMQPAS